ncbi:MAG: TetR/AcrR family transcriptional regulator [Burkholderiaceae bacterium]
MNKISKLDWIQGGFRTLTSDGHLAIKAEVIARDLGVSKGSFYWHFDNVAAFKIAMLEHWVAQGTDGIMSQVRNADAEPSDQLRSLVNTITAELNAPYGGLLAESAIRNWARFDPQVLLSVRRVDQSRLKFLASLFRRAGGSAEISRRFANLFYSGLIGLEYLTHERLAKLKTDLPVLLDLLLESINPGEN